MIYHICVGKEYIVGDNMKVFNTGIIVGRFQPIHKGHEKIINIGLSLCNKVIILVGSSQESGTIRNPFDFEFRKQMITDIFKNKIELGRIVIAKLNDLTNEKDLTPKWGIYVLGKIENEYKLKPNCIIYGKDKNIRKCFTFEDTEKMTEIFVDRKSDNISATMVRELIIQDEKSEFKKYVNRKIYNKYDILKDKLLKIYTKD